MGALGAEGRPVSRRAMLGFGGALVVMAGTAGCQSAELGTSASAAALPQRLRDGELVIAMDPRKIDSPYDPIQNWAFTGVNLFHSALLTIDDDNQIFPDLATDYEVSADALAWTFTLRTDATFTTGAPVLAADVAFTWNKAKEAGQRNLPNFDRAEALDDQTVVLHLTAPSSVMTYYAAMLGIVPEAGYSAEDHAIHPIGSGPFTLVDHIQGQQLMIERNDDYYGQPAHFRKVTILMMGSDAALAAAQSGEVDVATVAENVSDLSLPGFTLASLETNGYRILSLPTVPSGAYEADGEAPGNDVTAHPEIRKAMSLGVNREQVFAEALYGYGTVAFDPHDVHPWGIADEIAGQVRDGDVEAAVALLDQTGWVPGEDGIRVKDNQRATFELMYPPTDSSRQAIAESFKAQMVGLGIEVILKGLSLDEQRAFVRTTPTVLGGGDQSPYRVYDMLSSTRRTGEDFSNAACYSNPTTDDHLDAALRATDQDEAYQNWRKALWDGSQGGSILGDAPYLMFGYIRHNYFVRDGVSLGTQRIHAHDHNAYVLANLARWDLA
ncbi:MAG: ABC transporter substrate-binding protein [Propioniciclava sp.]